MLVNRIKAPAMDGPTMREALNAADPSAIAAGRSSRATIAWTAAMRAGWPSASDAPNNTDSTSTASMVISSAKISVANSAATDPARI